MTSHWCTADDYTQNYEGDKGNMEFTEPVAPCTITYLKYINGFLLLIGFTLLGLGIYASQEWPTARFTAPPVIVLGSVVTVLALLGICGACASAPESSNLLRVYFFSMLFLMIIFLLMGSFTFVYNVPTMAEGCSLCSAP